MAKRKVQATGEAEHDSAKRRRSSSAQDEPEHHPQATPSATPSKLRAVLNLHDLPDDISTPTSVRKVLFSDAVTPASKARRLDSSARKKSQTKLLQAAEDVTDSEAPTLADADAAANILHGDTQARDDGALDDITVSQDTPTATPKLRGRPKGPKRERSPTPPSHMPPHELYFFQNRTGGSKTSDNVLPAGALLNHDDYFAQIKAYTDPHVEDLDFLAKLHSLAFDQWAFELQSNFSVCLYGYGSKRALASSFAHHLHDSLGAPTILIINGYNSALTIRDVITALSRAMLPSAVKVPAQPAAAIDLILNHLDGVAKPTPFYVFVHSLDAVPLRKHQLHIARLAAHPSIALLATVDTPNFSLLWPLPLQAQFRFLFHDATTFRPYDAEIETVDEVNSLLGRSGRRVGGKDGVVFVLRSLPENARLLFRLLVAEQLTLLDAGVDLDVAGDTTGGEDDDDVAGMLGFDDAPEDDNAGDEDDMDIDPDTPSRRGRHKSAPKKKRKSVAAATRRRAKEATKQVEGVEYRMLYHKAVEEFVCSSDMGFRTLLKEFYDHQIVESRKDGLGSERLVVPFGRAELESLMEELL